MSTPHCPVVVFCLRFPPFARLHRGQTTPPYMLRRETRVRRGMRRSGPSGCSVPQLVVDSTELDPAQLRHFPHLPLHHLTERILGPVHVAFRDISAEVVVPEAVRDARGDRLAFPASLLGEDAVSDRAHREVSLSDRSDAHGED